MYDGRARLNDYRVVGGLTYITRDKFELEWLKLHFSEEVTNSCN